MKKIKFIVLIFVYFVFIATTFAVDSTSKYFLENINTWEKKYIEYSIPLLEDSVFQMEMKKRVYYKPKVWDEVFENWKVVCQEYVDNNENKKSWECDISFSWNISKIRFRELTGNEKIDVVFSILYNIFPNYIIYFILFIPFNFFVFFWVGYVIFWRKISLVKYLFFTMFLTFMLDIMLIYLNFSYIQLKQTMLWAFLYIVCIITPKLCFLIFSSYKFSKYRKKIKSVTIYDKISYYVLMFLSTLFIFYIVFWFLEFSLSFLGLDWIFSNYLLKVVCYWLLTYLFIKTTWQRFYNFLFNDSGNIKLWRKTKK